MGLAAVDREATGRRGQCCPGPREGVGNVPDTGRVGNGHVCPAEIQSKRQERKRRSTANPAYSGLLETEVRPLGTWDSLLGWEPRA